MPVLINTGEHPIMAAWLFYTKRDQLEALRDAIRQGGYSAGMVDADPEGKARDTTDAYLIMARAEQDSATLPDADEQPASAHTERVVLGITTHEAARRYLQPREVEGSDGEKRGLGIPGLPQLADFIDKLLERTPDLRWAVWSLDQQGVLNMAPAREVKPISGNILKVKL